MEKVVAVINGDFRLAAMQILGDAAIELMFQKELALQTAEKIGVPRERAEADIADVLDLAAQHFEEMKVKDRIRCGFTVHEIGKR